MKSGGSSGKQCRFLCTYNLMCVFDRTILRGFPHLGKAHCARQLDLDCLVLSSPSQGQLRAEKVLVTIEFFFWQVFCWLLQTACGDGNECCGSCNNDYNTSVEIQTLI